MLRPGNYRLIRDVKNPAADRRKKLDWRNVPIWSEGEEFLVEDQRGRSGGDPGDVIDRVADRMIWTRILAVGCRWSHQSIRPGSEQYAALEAALVPCEESAGAMFTSLGVSHEDGFARWLLLSGKLDRDTFRALWNQYLSDDSRDRSDGLRIHRLLPQRAPGIAGVR